MTSQISPVLTDQANASADLNWRKTRLLSVEEASAYLCAHGFRMSTATLVTRRARGRDPVYVKLGYKTVRYRQCDLDAYIKAHFTVSTDQDGASADWNLRETPLLSAEEASAYLCAYGFRMSTSTLEKRRARGRSPAYVKLGYKTVRYRQCDLDAFIKAHFVLMQGGRPVDAT